MSLIAEQNTVCNYKLFINCSLGKCYCLACHRNRRSQRNDVAGIKDRMEWRAMGLSMSYIIQEETNQYDFGYSFVVKAENVK